MISIRNKSNWVRVTIVLLFFLISLWLCFWITDKIFPFPITIDYSTVILDDKGDIIHSFLSEDDKWRLFLRSDEITEDFKKAILFKEDQHFYYHFGVNPFSITRAFIQNTSSGQRKSGASTITMQVARLLNPKARTYGNKFIEIFNAIQLEYHFSKDEILRMYLNLLPYGGNIEGIKSASNIYFGKAPEVLSLSEIAALVVIPNRPTSLAISKNHQAINDAKNLWLNRFKNAGLFNESLIKLALDETIRPKRRALPREVPHLSIHLQNKLKHQHIIETFIDLEHQKQIEQLTKVRINQLKQLNINNAAILVVDNESRQVIHYVGSADFYSYKDAGQVDGTRGVRSPGSTLKPFLFGLHFDQGTLSPKSRILDVSSDFQGYRPVNYDNEFHGWVRAEEALQQSLNIPAVQLLNDFGIQSFCDALASTSFKTIADTQTDLGLSVILGGCGATLQELTALYAAFANRGQHQPLKYYKSEKQDSLVDVVLSEEAAFILTDVLTEVTRPDMPNSWKDNPNRPKIAWKTGTSFGRRDAWSIGYSKKYTVGVWAGNFSGEGAPELAGAEVAAPLLFDVFNLLSPVSTYDWYTRPSGVDKRRVCDDSGLIPNVFCENIVIDYAITDVTKYNLCQHLVPALISSDSSLSYCRTCVNQSEHYIEAMYPSYPIQLVDYFQSQKVDFPKIPPHYKFCERVYPDQDLEIISPTDQLHYYVDKADSSSMLLKALAPPNANTFYWYVNDVFFKTVDKDTDLYFNPPEGTVKISCSDDRGRNQDITITVDRVTF